MKSSYTFLCLGSSVLFVVVKLMLIITTNTNFVAIVVLLVVPPVVLYLLLFFSILLNTNREAKFSGTMKFEYNAIRVLHLNSNSRFVEKGGGRDGDYKYSKVTLIIPDDDDGGHHPYVSIRYGFQNTAIASVNRIPAQTHKLDDKTIILVLKNHAGWTNGMTRIHFVTFKYESDAHEFKETYNEISSNLPKNGKTSSDDSASSTTCDDDKLKNCDVVDTVVDEDEYEVSSEDNFGTSLDGDKEENELFDSRTKMSLDGMSKIGPTLANEDEDKDKDTTLDGIFDNEACTQDWPYSFDDKFEL